MNDTIQLVYITAANGEEAGRLAHAVVGERLAACANILGPIRSIYWWDGRVNDEAEVGVIMKTTKNQMDSLIARVRVLHSYDCPCIVVVPVIAGNPDFLAWVAAQVSPAATP